MKKTVAFLGIIASLTGCATVDPGERGIVVTQGVMSKNLLQPGMTSINPFFGQSLKSISIQQQTVDGECKPLTSDQQQITIKYKVQYACPENQLLNLFQNYQGDPYESLVAPQVQEAFRAVVAGHKADSVTKELTTIKNQVLAQVKENVKGLVTVTDIPITHIDLPQVLQEAIAQKQIMEQQSLQKAYELDKAKKEGEITVANARAEAESTKLAAQAQAEQIRAQSAALAQSPAVIEYEKVKKWNGVLPSTVLGNSTSMINLK